MSNPLFNIQYGFCGVHIGIFAHTLNKTVSQADFDWTDFEFNK